MGKNSEVKNRTGCVLCSADMVHVITKPQLRYPESTNPKILRMARTILMLTTKGGRPLLQDRKNSSNPGICRNHKNGRNRIKLLYRDEDFRDLFVGKRRRMNIMDIGNDMVVLIYEYDLYTVLYFSYIVILPYRFYGSID